VSDVQYISYAYGEGLLILGNGARYATGGSIPGVLPRLSDQALSLSNSVGNTGNVRLLCGPLVFWPAGCPDALV